MISGLPLSEIAALAAALAAGGLVTGFFAGLLGIGGGGVIVPVLYELFGIAGVSGSIRMQVCVATSLAIIIPTSVRSLRSHWLRGAVDFSVIRRLGPWVATGAVLGVFIGSNSPAGFLKGVFVASTLFMAFRIVFREERAIAAEKLPGMPWDGLAGSGIGLISTLIGIGGGAYVTAYMRLFGWSIHKAVATASGFGPIIAIPAVIGYIVEGWGYPVGVPLSLGYVSLPGLLVVAPVSVLAAPLGVRVAHRLSRRTLEYIFLAFLLSVSLRFFLSLILQG
ncbi:MAG: sulfite exporter TauE/SafE family protein [Rhodomicrobium sp.]|nr:sulfite exporter TauE/SafE family protein [Rhodomicrobium sp.]